jgi:hypothetical protein
MMAHNDQGMRNPLKSVSTADLEKAIGKALGKVFSEDCRARILSVNWQPCIKDEDRLEPLAEFTVRIEGNDPIFLGT